MAILLGLELSDRRLHTDVYSDLEPPHRSKNEQDTPPYLTPEAGIVHRAMCRTLMPRSGYREGITTPQQHLLRAFMQRIRFCVVDFLIAEMEDVITDGMGAHRSFPFAHYISHMLSRIDHDPEAPPLPQMVLFRAVRMSFPTHKARVPTAPRVPVQGPMPP